MRSCLDIFCFVFCQVTHFLPVLVAGWVVTGGINYFLNHARFVAHWLTDYSPSFDSISSMVGIVPSTFSG